VATLVNNGQQIGENSPLFPYVSEAIPLNRKLSNCLIFLIPLPSSCIPLIPHHRLEGVVAYGRAGSSPAFGTMKLRPAKQQLAFFY